MAPPRFQTLTFYGPFHRRANPDTQGAGVMRQILAGGELWGGPPCCSDIPAVKAFFGSLPTDARGFEFFAMTPPDQPWGGVVYWRERDDGSVWVDEELARINVVVRRVEQEY